MQFWDSDSGYAILMIPNTAITILAPSSTRQCQANRPPLLPRRARRR